ncbi:hypothetical protein GCM10010166_34390 [Couchioplanes caeruleus subsp. azureus]|nr:hypothetical protein GCM10010166_34390 [Couchioplanes caeruleus subsp. azureus]
MAGRYRNEATESPIAAPTSVTRISTAGMDDPARWLSEAAPSPTASMSTPAKNGRRHRTIAAKTLVNTAAEYGLPAGAAS